jgi:hypothetical protein
MSLALSDMLALDHFWPQPTSSVRCIGSPIPQVPDTPDYYRHQGRAGRKAKARDMYRERMVLHLRQLLYDSFFQWKRRSTRGDAAPRKGSRKGKAAVELVLESTSGKSLRLFTFGE